MKTLSKLQQLSFIIRREFLAISTSYAVLLVLMGGIFVYGLLYNYMYAPNIVTDVPVAVVDNSHSELSRILSVGWMLLPKQRFLVRLWTITKQKNG